MALNPVKTKYMLITTRQKRQNLKSTLPLLMIGNESVEEVKTHKVLGVIIDNNLSWKDHIIGICKVLSKGVFIL